MTHGSSSENVKQQEQSWIESCSSARAEAISWAFVAGLLRMLRARRVAVLVPIPGKLAKLLINLSRAGGMICILLIR
jgi:hypothetical protein